VVPAVEEEDSLGGATNVTELDATNTPPPSPLLLFFKDVDGAACVSDSASEAEGGAVLA
jgi:hypothetical protein